MSVNKLRQRQNGCHFPDNIFKCIFCNENIWISIEISLKFVPKCLINNIPALVQIMAWHRPGDKPLSEPMLVSLPTHICIIRPQWVNCFIIAPVKTLRLGDTCMCQWIGSSLAQIMAWRLSGAKPLSEPMMTSVVRKELTIVQGLVH